MKLYQYCESNARREAVAASDKIMPDGNKINGIDYLEVLDRDAPSEAMQQRIIDLTFLKTDGVTKTDNITGNTVSVLGIDQFAIEGGERIRHIRIEKVEVGPDPKTLRLTLDRYGDFSTYALRLRTDAKKEDPPANMDPVLSRIEFTFKAECATDFDCKSAAVPPGPGKPGPVLDYLAKDYESFRQLMLDRMAEILPSWQERSPADLGVTLVEALAYAADDASYYQDAVATEAYLPLSRRRTSVRRHARLLGYHIHEGCNARTYVCVIAKQNVIPAQGAAIPKGTRLATCPLKPEGEWPPGLRHDKFEELRHAGIMVFETMEALWELRTKRNGIALHSWGEQGCCLPKGTTAAHLVGKNSELGLAAGDVLILEELVPAGGTSVDPAEITHRQAVRLVSDPVERVDPLEDVAVLEVHWHPEDKLRFSLNLLGDQGNPGAVARANVVLADHGETVASALHPPQCEKERPYRPKLDKPNLTYAMPYDRKASRKMSAAATLRARPHEAIAAVELSSRGEIWRARQDLLGSDRFALEFVVETESDGSAAIRFGDGRFGKQPTGESFAAEVRVGNGTAGNIGPDSIAHIETNDPDVIDKVSNPLPAEGGTAPETLAAVKINAPRAFRKLERAVTPDDYSRAVEGHELVQRAVAERRWTGSWHTMFIAVDPMGGNKVDAQLEQKLREHLESFRLAGHDVEIERPDYVPLDIALAVCVDPDHYAADVHQALLDSFGTGIIFDGTRGFFHPDNFTFGTPVYLSQMVARAMKVPGVHWIGLKLEGVQDRGRFRRLYNQSVDYGDDGVIPIGRRELCRLDNNPNAPENGRLQFFMEGAR